MKVDLDITNEVPDLFNEEEISFLDLTLTTFQKCNFNEEEVYISLLFTDDKIQEINKKYRNKDTTTDVISFAQLDETVGEKKYIRIKGMPLILGDIIINVEQAKRQKDALEQSLAREISFLYVHGLLHLLKYDHILKEDEEIMCALQKEILYEFRQQ